MPADFAPSSEIDTVRVEPSVPSASRDASPNGLHYSVAAAPADAIDAWQLVYRCYLERGLIDPNPHHLHTVPQAFTNDTAVIRGRIGDVTVSTISAYLDGPGGLPLDSVYPDELARLRASGGRLVEVGLFADRRRQLGRSIASLLELMRYATWFALHHDSPDAVIGVHPHHAAFYTRLLGFQILGEVRAYSTVRDNPVVLLHVDWRAAAALPTAPRGMRAIQNDPVSREVFASRVTSGHLHADYAELCGHFESNAASAA